MAFVPRQARWSALVLAVLSTVLSGCGAGAASPTDTLAQRGYKASADGVCRAVSKGDVEALRLMAQAGVTQRTLVVDGDRFCLEGPLAGRAGKVDIAALLEQVQPAPTELNRAYASTTGMTARDVPQAEALARAAGQRAIDLYAGGAAVEATPLMWAVWSGNADAVQSLLARGVDPNLPSVVPVLIGGSSMQLGQQTMVTKETVRISVTPLFEAHRLRNDKIVALLSRMGAKPVVSAEKPKV